SVAELERMNPGIEHNLPIGYRLVLGTSSSVAEKPEPTVTEIYTPATNTTEILHTIKKTPFANYEVKPQETLYSLSKILEITEAELINLNQMLKDG
ncbi:LysM peptidoglycan-binding domain-containing protein, partial [Klebsiella pneumoniae]|uniref:LysM peptidoglycan-binding domain-containing protein n=1 Tax=Klebsiella pneumoniae TaxID=573 RepID=UPI0022B9FCF4